jgi:putative ABC transport system ATP-binding protein
MSPNNSSSSAVVLLKEVQKSYKLGSKRLDVLKSVSMAVYPGEYVAVMGPSGSGKSTLLNILGLLDSPDQGSYFLVGEDVSQLHEDHLARQRNALIGFIFQSFNLFPQFNVLENVEVPMAYAGYPKRKRHKRAMEMIELVGLADRAHHRPQELSGGQMQRTAIARALVNNPPLLLADEPTGNLDEKTGLEVLKIFDELITAGRTLIMVTHNDTYRARVHRVLEMRDGAFIS